MNLLLVTNGLIFYILAVICFSAFVVILLWYLLANKKDNGNKQTKSWTIESAKKFLASQNVEMENSNEKANKNIEIPKKPKTDNLPKFNKPKPPIIKK